jgi:hypothetical protein
MMKRLLSFVSLVAISMILIPIEPAMSHSANDTVCKFKYKMGDKVWVKDSRQGTTLILAKKSRSKRIDLLKSMAQEKNQELKVVYLHCNDPWGRN